MELLEEERKVQLQFGRLPPIRRSAFSKGFGTQLYHVLCKKLQLTRRDMELLGLTIALKAFMGIFLGLIFQGVGKKEPKGIAQMSFVFMILIQVSLGALNLLPMIIEERTIMKLEESDGLYCVSAHMLAQTTVDTAVSLIGSAAQVTIMYFMAEFEPEFFPAIFFYILICGLAMESLVVMMAASAKNAAAAQASATPVVMIFIMFSGFLVSRNTSPEFLKWILEISPMSHTIEMVAWQLYGDDTMAWGSLQMAYGFQEPSTTAYLGVNFSVMLFARALQVVFLSKLNNIER
jgi:ABC-type multidrug transport system permease subunit